MPIVVVNGVILMQFAFPIDPQAPHVPVKAQRASLRGELRIQMPLDPLESGT
jgi:hypothetical protein